ncbi:MAG TPA: CAP domain-containing protein [Aggregatilinea sp.]|jgi:uncharacterized protein YkwD|uniref:CAP domain-containing protein n=1 Tax=Aggregatilinea sp. TaxID=2806333 RepID=UPI002CDAF891|nr:CAP domain-containing protein [Aggregatilinea sp.]HML24006.1 CAP domain-containing protein [Aggregatilinea sp.]
MCRNRIVQVLLILVVALSAVQLAPAHRAAAQSDDQHVLDVLAKVNQVRAEAGLGALTLNDALNAAAQRQINDMTSNDFLGHTGSDGSNPGQRISDAGYSWRAAGENALYRFDYSVDGAVGQWVDSPSHRAAMLNAAYVDAGIAYGQSASGKVYYVLVMAAPM